MTVESNNVSGVSGVSGVSEVDLVYDQIKDWLGHNETINASNIIVLVTLLIKCVENVAKDKEGSYKKELVLKVLTKVINESNLEPNAKISLQTMVQFTIPILIDTMIGISTNKFDLGKSVDKGIDKDTGKMRCMMC